MRGVLINYGGWILVELDSYAGSAHDAAQTSWDFPKGRVARRDG